MQFPHRHNSDGSFDSICRHCVATIATAMDEAELARGEALHECDPALLEYYYYERRCRQPNRREERKDARSNAVKPVQDFAQILHRYWKQIQALSQSKAQEPN